MKLEYILIAIFIGFLLHILISHRREHLEVANNANVMENNKIDPIITTRTSTPENQSVNFNGSLLNDKQIKEPPTHDFKSTYTYCPVEAEENEVTKYWREIALGGKYACPPPPPEHKYNFEDIQSYQDKFYGFNDMINQNTGMMGYDSVDRVNQLYLQGNNELSDQKGVTISDLFNGLTNNNKDKMETIYKRCTQNKNESDKLNYGISDDSGYDPNAGKIVLDEGNF
jgi:hypothetical protein